MSKERSADENTASEVDVEGEEVIDIDEVASVERPHMSTVEDADGRPATDVGTGDDAAQLCIGIENRLSQLLYFEWCGMARLFFGNPKRQRGKATFGRLEDPSLTSFLHEAT